jgi:hypothetical protein
MKLGRIFWYLSPVRKEKKMRPFALGISVLLFLICTGAGHAQIDTLGRMVLQEGLRYRITTIRPRIAPGETPFASTQRCILTSESGSRVTFNGTSVIVPAGGSVDISISSTEPVELRGTQPFGVLSMQDGYGHGEAARHLPSYAWGTSYRPFLWWQDEYGLASETPTVTTSAISVVADVDDTRVSLTLPSGKRDTTLNAGEQWYVQFDQESGRSRNDSTDYTGQCLVESTHPVTVVSGHEKAAVLRHPNNMPKSGNYERAATRSRGNLHDAMLPTTYAGTTFVTSPILYTPTRLRGRDLSLIDVEDDRGDVVRFIALEDSTAITSLSSSPTSGVNITLNAGESWYAPRVELATLWFATKPVLCAQYGKSYAYITWQSTQPLDDPSTDAGMPQLQIVPPVEHWVDHAIVVAPSETASFLSLVCSAQHESSILVDGRPIASMLRKRRIGDSFMVSFEGPILPGEHRITPLNPNVRFAAWSYGSVDGLSVGNIYGAVTGINMAAECDGEPTLRVVRQSDSVVIAYGIPDTAQPCLATAMTYFEQCDGCAIEERPQGFVVRRTQPNVRVVGVVRTVATNGMYRRAAFSLDGTVGVAEANADLHVGPNPTSDYVIIKRSGVASLTGTYRVWSHIGQCVREFRATDASTLRIDLSDLAPGIYHIDGDAVHTIVVKQ